MIASSLFELLSKLRFNLVRLLWAHKGRVSRHDCVKQAEGQGLAIDSLVIQQVRAIVTVSILPDSRNEGFLAFRHQVVTTIAVVLLLHG